MSKRARRGLWNSARSGSRFSRSMVPWRKVDYDQDAEFQGENLAFQLNRTMTGGGVGLRYALTPLTSLTVSADRTQDRFEFSRCATRIRRRSPVVCRLDPQALIKGSATFGYRNFQPLVPGLPDYQGATALGALSYTLLGATRFASATQA